MDDDSRWWMLLTIPLLGLMLAAGAHGATAADDDVILPAGQATAPVRVDDVATDGDAMRGRVVNAGPVPVEDVRVLVRDSFRWRDEFRPGHDDPGRAAEVTVPGPIPPGTSVPFAVALPPRPARADGRFVPGADVLGWVALEPPATR